MYMTQFVVKGAGKFPFNMQFTDRCYPASVEDSVEVGRMSPLVDREVTLIHLGLTQAWVPTKATWQSFSWPVQTVQPTVKVG